MQNGKQIKNFSFLETKPIASEKSNHWRFSSKGPSHLFQWQVRSARRARAPAGTWWSSRKGPSRSGTGPPPHGCSTTASWSEKWAVCAALWPSWRLPQTPLSTCPLLAYIVCVSHHARLPWLYLQLVFSSISECSFSRASNTTLSVLACDQTLFGLSSHWNFWCTCCGTSADTLSLALWVLPCSILAEEALHFLVWVDMEIFPIGLRHSRDFLAGAEGFSFRLWFFFFGFHTLITSSFLCSWCLSDL